MLELAILEARAPGEVVLVVVAGDLLLGRHVPGVASYVEDAGSRSLVITAKPGAVSIEPVCA